MAIKTKIAGPVTALFLVALVNASAHGQLQSTIPSTGANSLPQTAGTTGSAIFTFADLFGMRENAVLWGLRGTRTFTFPMPRNWKAGSGSKLKINLSHSPALLADMSDITFFLNGQTIKTIRLDANNSAKTSVLLDIPLNLLKDANTLELRFAQHYTRECEDPLSPSLWSQIDKDSSLTVAHARIDRPGNLNEFPFPFYDDRGLGPSAFSIVVPEQPSAAELTAAARLAAFFGALDTNRKTKITAEDSTSVPTIFIGTAGRNPGAKFVPDLPPQNSAKAMVAYAKRDGAPALVISAPNDAALLDACSDLIRRDYNVILSGRAASLGEKSNPSTPDVSLQQSKRLPQKSHFTLADLGYKTETVRGFEPGPIDFSLNDEPGITLLGPAPRFKLIYGYGAQLNPDLSTCEVNFNGKTIASYPLSNIKGVARHEEDISLPMDLFAPRNNLQVKFHLIPKSMGRCQPLIDWHMWGTVFSDCAVDIDFERIPRLPDLGLFKFDGYPFTAPTNLSCAAIVLPPAQAKTLLSQVYRVSSELGASTGYQGDNLLTVAYDNGFSDEIRTTRNLLVLDSTGDSPLRKELPALIAFTQRNDGSTTASAQAAISADQIARSSWIQETLSPWAKGKVVLVISAPNLDFFNQALQTLLSKSDKLDGTVVTVSDAGIIKSTRLEPAQDFGSVMPWRYLGILFSRYPVSAAVICVVVALAGVLMLRRFVALKRKSQST